MKKWWTIPVCMILLAASAVAAFATQEIKLIVDGKEIQSDVPPQLIKGRVFVPVRSVAEALNAEVEWDELDQSVTITRKMPKAQVVAQIPEAHASLYAIEHNGMYEKFELKVGQSVRTFPFWKSIGSQSPQILYDDINKDGNKEIIVVLTSNTGTGLFMSEAHVVQVDSLLKEVYVDNPLAVTWKKVDSEITPEGIKIQVNDQITEISKDKILEKHGNWFSQIYFGNQISFKVEDHQLKAFLSAQISPTDYIGEVQISYEYKDNLYQASNIHFNSMDHLK